MYAKGKEALKCTIVFITSMMGYIAMTARDLTRGKPHKTSQIPNNIASIVKGGGLGIAGDLIFLIMQDLQIFTDY